MTKAKRVCPIKGGGGGSAEGAVSYAEEQSLTKIQKDRARGNIGAVSKEELAGKANNDGYYSKMTVGAAESIVGGNETSREFTEDTAGGTADIADGVVQVERIKGNSVVWNQLFMPPIVKRTESDITITESDGEYTAILNSIDMSKIYYSIFGILSSAIYKVYSNHKYYLCFEAKSNNIIQRIRCEAFRQDGGHLFILDRVDEWKRFSSLITNAQDGNRQFNIFRFLTNTTISKETFNVGDYLALRKIKVIDLTQLFGAGNEPSTVEEFEKLFHLDYYNYNEGEILSLNPSVIKTIGFNAYNHTTGKASVIGGKQYQITGAYTSIAEGDTTITPDEDGLFTPTKNGDLTIAGGNSTTTCVHLVWSGVRNGEFEEHWEETRNIPVSQINTDGTITESAVGKTRLFPNGLCSVGGSFDEVSPKKAIKRIGARAYEDGDNEDTSVLTDGTTTLYVLETPIEVTFAEPLNLNYRVSDFGTETLLPINGSEPATAPIKMDVVYGLNVVDFVRNADKNYLTIEDSTGDNGSAFTNLRSALSSAFGIDVVPTYDAANKRYTFTISDNRKVEVPESATASGLKGTWAEDATAVYFCTDTNVWVKIAKTNW